MVLLDVSRVAAVLSAGGYTPGGSYCVAAMLRTASVWGFLEA